MSIAEDMKSITENIMVSYNQRVKDVDNIVNDTKATLKRFKVEHHEMSVELKKELAKSVKDMSDSVNDMIGKYRADINKASEAWSSMTVALAKAREKGFVPSVEVGKESISRGKKKSK